MPWQSFYTRRPQADRDAIDEELLHSFYTIVTLFLLRYQTMLSLSPHCCHTAVTRLLHCYLEVLLLPREGREHEGDDADEKLLHPYYTIVTLLLLC
jgi:hypothetical protein